MSDPVAALAKPSGLPYVFLGPSLPLEEARRKLDAVYLPPVAMGDVFRLMARRPTVIAIIDGLFEQTPAVWHKEILFAMSRGVRVLGASSMGALRAAELAAFGMEGVGEVFQAFHSGMLEDDDEVAVAHAPASDGYRCLSDAMVNIRAGLRAARDAGNIGDDTHDRLVAAAKELYYPDRSWPRLFQVAAAMGIDAGQLAALRQQVAQVRPDVKRADAIRLLERLAAEGAAGVSVGRRAGVAPVVPEASFDFEPTFFWEQMIVNEAVVSGLSDLGEGGVEDGVDGGAGAPLRVGAAELRRHLRVHGSRAGEAMGAALLLYLADEQASRRGVALTAEGAEGAKEGAPGAAVQASPALPGVELLSADDRDQLERSRRAVDHLLRAIPDQINRRLPAALAHLGRLEPTLVEVRRKQAILRSLGVRAAEPADAGLSVDDLLDWYRRRFGPLAGSPEEHALTLGFASLEEFVSEVVLEFLADKTGEPVGISEK